MNTDNTSSEIADDSNGDDELSEKLRDDKLLIDHVRSQGRVESCQERTTTPTTRKNRKWFWLLLVAPILSIVGLGVIILFLSFFIHPEQTKVIIDHSGEGSFPVPGPPVPVDRSFTIEPEGPSRLILFIIPLIPWALLAAIVCILIYIVIYAVSKNRGQTRTEMPTIGTAAMQENLRPHRGAAILALGIIGLVLFVYIGIIPGIIAWVMGNRDLWQMNAGTVDPAGRGMTQAGKICGIIAVILTCVFVGITLLIFFGMSAERVTS